VLERLLVDLAAQAPDHVAITGDLTNVALEEEFEGAARWLERIGTPDHVSLVPGNHDAYVELPAEKSWDLWADYLADDARRGARAPAHADYPILRVRGGLALVGLCSAQPKGLFEATGTLGETQLERLGPLLEALRARELCRVVLVHHPVVDGGVARRRRLTDSASLRAVLQRAGAELVLHGHGHRSSFASAEGPDGAIPVIGVRSSSHAATSESRRAQYHLYEIEPAAGGRRWRIRARVRGYHPARDAFGDDGDREL
jgi:3',5'-cyclic AMP phosphodiesterase CpdA